MKKSSPKPSARILRHGGRADEITNEAIEVRAGELAEIDGRTPAEITVADRARALAELRGETLPEAVLQDDEMHAGMSRDPSEPRSITGKQTPTHNEPEDQVIEERLALEGVEEAQHEQMLADRRRRDT
jgi:hypothetical protein